MTIDRRSVAATFGAASGNYDVAAQLQARTREELLTRLEHFALAPRVILDLGAGTGHAAAVLARRFPNAMVIAVDLAVPMLQVAGRHLGWRERFLRGRFGHPFTRVAADARSLPLADGCVDLVFSNCMLQWCDDLDAALTEIRRVCTPRAMFTLSSFGPTTLQELRAAFGAVDQSPHVNEFVDMHDLGSALVRAGFEEPVLDVDRYRDWHADVRSVMRSLKEIGATNAHTDRPRGLFGRGRLLALENEYARFANDAGALPVSWEIVYATAFAAPDATKEIVVPLTRLARKARP